MASHTTGWGYSMSAQTTPAQGFPTPCTRCGGVLYQHVDFCPYCGVDHPLERAPRKRTETALKAVDTHPSQVPALASAGELAALESPDTPIPPLDVPQPFWQTAGHWLITKGLVLLVFVLALGYAGYLLLGDNHKQDGNSEESSTNSSGGSISPYTPQPAATLPSSTITNVPPSGATRNLPAVPVVPAMPATPATPGAPPPPRVVQHYRDVPGGMQAARAALAQNNLLAAKAAVADVLSIDRDNSDALALQNDIRGRENRRDVALGVANTCAKDKLWSCVRERASQALAIDASSADAQSLLERVILSTGWKSPATAAPAAAPAPAPQTSAGTPPLPPLPTLPPLPPTGIAQQANGTANNATSNAANNTAGGTAAANGGNSIDAQMRAIRESGWKHAPSSGAANKQ